MVVLRSIAAHKGGLEVPDDSPDSKPNQPFTNNADLELPDANLEFPDATPRAVLEFPEPDI